MLRLFSSCVLVLVFLLPIGYLTGQSSAGPAGEPKDVSRENVRLPNGKLQQDEILKQDHNRELQEARQLVELSQALQKDIEQSGADVLSISSIHKTEEIEKLAKRIRSRMRGY
jgi:hypothetical protein